MLLHVCDVLLCVGSDSPAQGILRLASTDENVCVSTTPLRHYCKLMEAGGGGRWHTSCCDTQALLKPDQDGIHAILS